MRGVPLLLIACVTLVPGTATARPGITAPADIARVYDAIFDARLPQVPGLLAKTCVPTDKESRSPSLTAGAPPEVCRLLEVQALWWRIQLDPFATDRDAEFVAAADGTIAAIETWTRREPQRAEAWFYLGGAYAARVQWRVLRGQQLAAARDGKRIKDALERALELDPDLQDAYFGIGLYHYYADVAPAAAKLLRWLLLLPGGDRTEGLQEMLRAKDHGQLLRSEADYQLHLLYLWYEKQPARALQLLGELRGRYPHNPLFPQLVAEVQEVYLHDAPASLATWRSLLDSARAGRVAEPAMTEARAHLGMALELDRLRQTDEAIEHLQAVINAHPQAPIGAVALAQLQLGQLLDRRGARSGAIAAYRAALQSIPDGDPLKTAPKARDGLRKLGVRLR